MSLFPRRTLLAASLVAVLALPSAIMAADKKAETPTMTGADTSMISNTCAGCHGTNGVSSGPSIPTLAGMSSTYIVDMMEAYKSDDVPSTIMGRLAKGYTTEEFEQMGEFFAKQKFVAAEQESDKAKAEKGAKLHADNCDKCHTEGGTVADDDAGFLKGQWKSYLSSQLADFQSGERDAAKKMLKSLKKIHDEHGDEGIEALVEYYSSK